MYTVPPSGKTSSDKPTGLRIYAIEDPDTGDGAKYEPVYNSPPTHTHSFSLTKTQDGGTVKVKCTKSGCNTYTTNREYAATLTVTGAGKSYDGKPVSATLTKDAGFPTEVTTGAITYVGRGSTTYNSSTAPSGVGSYTAQAAVGDKTASVDFDIVGYDPIYYVAGLGYVPRALVIIFASRTQYIPLTQGGLQILDRDGKRVMDNDWYVVKEPTIVPGDLYYGKNVNLIVPDGLVFGVTGSVKNFGSELTLYGQEGQTGTLHIDGPAGGAALEGGTIKVAGGTLEIVAGEGGTIAAGNGTIEFPKGVVASGVGTDGNPVVLSDGSTDKVLPLLELNSLKSLNATALSMSTLTTAPVAKDSLEYDGTAQDLVDAGVAEGGTVMYALGDETAAPTAEDAWSDKVPTATEAGDYHVWWRVAGDETHADTITKQQDGQPDSKEGDPARIDVSIAKRPVTISGASVAESRSYDGTAVAEITSYGTLQNVATADASDSAKLSLVTSNATATFKDVQPGDGKNVGQDKAVEFSGYTLEGTAADNYELAQPEDTTATIVKRKIVVTGILAVDKDYDGSTTAELTTEEAVFVDWQTHEDVVDDGIAVGVKDLDGNEGQGTFADGVAGQNKRVIFEPYLIAGANADETGNYELVVKDGQTTTLATISPVVVTLNWANTALTYNGSAQAPTATVTNKKVATDDVTVTVSGAQKNKGTYTATATALAGTAAGNYRLPDQATQQFTIAAKALNVTGATAKGKTYDGTTTAQIDNYGTLGGALAGDDVSLDTSGTSAAFANKDAGTGKTVTFSGYKLKGAAKDNYAVNQPAATTADIAPLTATLSWSNTQLTYTGSAQGPTASVTNAVSGDTVSVTVTGQQTNANDDATPTYTATASALTGADAANYALPTDGTQNQTFTITEAPATANPAPAAKTLTYNGGDQDLVTAGSSTTGTLQYALGTSAPTTEAGWSAAVPTGKNAGSYKVWWRVKGDANHSDSAAASIDVRVSPLTVTLSWSNTQLNYTGSAQAPTASVSNAVAGDNVQVTVSGQQINVGTNYTATATALMIGGLPAGNYVLPTSKTATFSIAKVDPTVTTDPVAAQGLVYNGTDLALLATEGAVQGGTVQYAVTAASATSAPTDETSWSATAPKEKNAGDYKVWWRVKGDANHNDRAAEALSVSIAKRTAVIKWSTKKLVYNGKKQAPTASISNIVSGDKVSITVTGKKTDANTEATPSYTATAAALKGDAAANYVLPSPAPTKSYTIGKKTVNVTGVTAEEREYDGTTTATAVFTDAVLSGVITADASAVALDTSAVVATFDDVKPGDGKNAGEGKAVSVEGIALSGTKAHNYEIGNVNDVTATIKPKEANVWGVVIKPRPYDGTTAAELDASDATITGIIAGDVVNVKVTETDAAFTDPGVGLGKDVYFTPVIEGNDAANYSVNIRKSQTRAFGDITAREIVVKAKDQSVNKGDELKTSDLSLVEALKKKDDKGADVEGTGLADGQALSAITLVYNPSTSASAITNPGTITPGVAAIKDAKGNETTANYAITYEAGKLEISADPQVTVVAKQGLKYTGSKQTLVTVTKPEGTGATYTVQFAVSKSKPADDSTKWTTTLPKGTNAGSYTVWWRVPASAGWNAVEVSKVVATIAKADISPSVSITGWTYLGRNAQTNAASLGTGSNPGSGAVTWEYKGKNDPDTAYAAKTEAELDALVAGDYVVRATIAETANYKGGSATKDFKVDKLYHTVTFDPNGGRYEGEAPKPQQVEHGKTAQVVAVPTFDSHHRFIAWFDENDIEFIPGETPVNEDVTAKADWLIGRTVTFDPSNGEDGTEVYVAYRRTVAKPDDPAREGFVFDGWFTSKGEEYDFSKTVTNDLTLTAHWTPEGAEYADVSKTLEVNDFVGVIAYVKNLSDAKHLDRYAVEASFVGKETVSGTLAELVESGGATYSKKNGYRIRVADADARQYGEQAHIRVTYTPEGGQPLLVDESDYGPRDYCEYAVEKYADNQKVVDICRSLMDLGAAAQVQFNYKTDDLPNVNVTNGADVVAATVVPDEYAAAIDGECTGVEQVNFSLNLVSATELRVYFYPESGSSMSDYDFEIDGQAVQAKASGSRWLLSLPGIAATKLGQTHEFKATRKGDGTSIAATCSALSYAHKHQSNQSATVATVCKALYLHALAAKAMFPNA